MSEEFVIVEKEQLSSIANAVRNSTGSNDRFNASQLSNIVVETLGADREIVLQNKTVTPSTSTQTVVPDNGYDGLSQVTVNAMPTATQATPSINVSSSGLITASTTQSAGYVAAGTKSATKQLTVQAAQTITPGTSNKTIASGRYLTGTQTIKGDANLKAANIASGVSIFGVTGTHSGGSTIETCTVQITYSGTSITAGYYTAIDSNGAIVSKRFGPIASITLQDVVCNTSIFLYGGIVAVNYQNCSGHSPHLHWVVADITAASGTTATITGTAASGGGSND